MKVVIFGADGQLGQAMRQVFSLEDTYCFSRKEIDITSSVIAKPILYKIWPDYIINCAAYTDVERAEIEPHICRRTNVNALEWLSCHCEKTDIKLVHFSTNFVFGQEDPDGYSEDRPPKNAITEYGNSKRIGELEIAKHMKQYYIIRTSWLFGPSGKNNYIQRIWEQADCGWCLEVANDEWACPTYTFDLAQAVYDMCVERSPFGVYHLVNEGPTTKAIFAQKILEFSGRKMEVTPINGSKSMRLTSRPKYGILLNTKRPKLRPWQQALRECIIGMTAKASTNETSVCMA